MFQKHVTIYGVIPEAGHVKEHMASLLNLDYDNTVYLSCPHLLSQKDALEMCF